MAHPTLAPKQKWQPTASDIITIVGLVAAVIMWYVQLNWGIGAPVTIITIIVVIAAAVRHQSHPLIRIPIACAVVLVLIAVAWRPVWTSFRKDYPRATFNWPIALNPPEVAASSPSDPPDLPPTNLPGPALSKAGKSMFLCQFPENVVSQDPEAALAGIKQNLDIFGRATGLSLVINRIPYGFRIDATADSAEGQIRMGGLQRNTIQVERTTQGLFVTLSFDIGALGILTMMPVDPKIQKTLTTFVSQLAGVSEEKCRML